MDKLRKTLRSRVHDWIKKVGFRLNSSNTLKNDNLTVDHYFFKTFNFIEQRNADSADKSEFVCFDTYGEKIKVRSLLDLQSAFYENLSQLR
jgi:hypothetical protein